MSSMLYMHDIYVIQLYTCITFMYMCKHITKCTIIWGNWSWKTQNMSFTRHSHILIYIYIYRNDVCKNIHWRSVLISAPGSSKHPTLCETNVAKKKRHTIYSMIFPAINGLILSQASTALPAGHAVVVAAWWWFAIEIGSWAGVGKKMEGTRQDWDLPRKTVCIRRTNRELIRI